MAGVDKANFLGFLLRVKNDEEFPQTHVLTKIFEADLKAGIVQTH